MRADLRVVLLVSVLLVVFWPLHDREEAVAAVKPNGSGPQVSAVGAEAEIREEMEQRRQASLAGDTEKIAASMIEEYLQTDISGYVQDKKTWLREYFEPLAELIKAGKFRWERFEEKDVQVRVNGDTAIAMGTMILQNSGARIDRERHSWVADPQAHMSTEIHFTRVYIRRNGRWLLAGLHNALVGGR